MRVSSSLLVSHPTTDLLLRIVSYCCDPDTQYHGLAKKCQHAMLLQYASGVNTWGRLTVEDPTPRQWEISGLYYTILYYTILYYTILYCTILYYTIPGTTLYYTIPYYTILYYTILPGILYYTTRYTILYYTILYYTILYYIPQHGHTFIQGWRFTR